MASTPSFLRVTAFCLVQAAAAQVSPRLDGVLYDIQDRAIPEARIRLTARGSGLTWETKSDPAGGFAFLSLAPGEYELDVDKEGFAFEKPIPVRLQVGLPVSVRVRLAPAGRAERITVSGETSLLNTRDATMGNAISGFQITQLPLEGRNVVALLSLQPGVVSIGDNPFPRRTNFGEADADQRNGAVSGARSDQTNVLLDGVDVNDQQAGFAFTSVLRPAVESVQEFRVVTAMPGADVWRSSGAQVSLVTRSGGNEVHGTAFYSHRNTLTSANDFFNNRAGIARPKLIRNIFGGTLGGPIVKNRLFLFGSYARKARRQ
jgi:hypothetical protein